MSDAPAFLAAAGGGRSSAPRAALVAVAVVASFVVAAGAMAGLRGDAPPMGAEQAALFSLMTGAAPFAAALAALAIVAPRAHARPFASLLAAGRWRWGEAGKGALAWTATVLAAAVAIQAVRGGTAPFAWWGAWSAHAVLIIALAGAAAFALQTFAEEATFRGWLLQEGRALPVWLNVLANAAAFGAAHWTGGPLAVAFAALVGAALAVATLARGGVEAAWGAHAANNWAVGALFYPPGAAPAATLDAEGLAAFAATAAAIAAFTVWAARPRPRAGAPGA